MKIAKLLSLAIGLCLLLDATCSFAAEKNRPKGEFITHGEFVADLVTSLGWEGGLPPEPKERDYLAILSGNRRFKFEAENVYAAKNDNVTVLKYELYGPFSGSGWLSGIAVPTTAHFKIFLPIDGTYTLTVAAKGDGQKWQLGGKEFTVSTGSRITQTKAGSVELPAGTVEINVVIPPEGAVDYFLVEAPALREIKPVKGWDSKSVLKRGELAEVTAILLDLDHNLPDDGKPLVISVADTEGLPASVRRTDISYLGKPLSQKWVRADFRGAQLDVPLKITSSGLYRFRMRALGDIVSVGIDNTNVVVSGKPYLEWVDLGNFRLDEGTHRIRPTLTSGQGIDVIEVVRKKASAADYMAICDLQGEPGSSVKRSEQDKILAALAEKFKERR